MEDQLREIWDVPLIRAATIFVASLVLAKFGELVLRSIALSVVRRTRSDLDDRIVEEVRRPLFWTAVLVGMSYAAAELPIAPAQLANVDSALRTVAILIWAAACFRILATVLTSLSRRGSVIVQPRTLPVFEMLLKLAMVSATIYFLFLTWRIDLTAWLASAGIVGIAVGFAAKDTLANLFSGIFIIADAPYKPGDFIVLDGGLRGQVTKIGIRSTRILTPDDVEITVPNAVIGGSKIVNETGGPHVKQRIRVAVDVAYGSDIDRVRAVLLTCPEGVTHVAHAPTPQVRLRELAAAGLRFELLVWLEEPAQRDAVIDVLNCAIYKAFAAAAIEIPFPQLDVRVRELRH